MSARSNGQPTGRSVPFVRDLALFGERTAVVTAEGTVTYRQLAARVHTLAARLGHQRRLVLVRGANTLDAVTGYLGALAGGHVVLLVPDDGAETLATMLRTYDPDVVVRPVPGGCAVDVRRPGSAHELHPDLALLLSTSGSTGAPKLVRLSYDNLQANAESIAAALDIRASDRAATTLPVHYCYGLSVVHSHLVRGAGLILTGLSVADRCFWDLFRSAGGTTFAGVPYTFDLLDRVGFDRMDVPTLRYVTQAGGRLAPERVARYAALGQRRGWDLFVMYGQTEATARMAVLPPDLARSHPHTIGRPVPGGGFRLRPLPDRPTADTGELVYSGPNVMLGYAHGPADLALGRTVRELPTGDIGRRTPDGLYEIVGRCASFVKILGLRIDPHRVETLLAERSITAACLGADDELVVVVVDPAVADRARRLVRGWCRLPVRAVRVCVLPQLPRLPAGKVDYPALRAATRPSATGSTARPVIQPAERPTDAAPRRRPADTADLCRLYADVLDRADVGPDDSFVSLGGDSLSYVEMSLRLEQVLGLAPPNWHTRTIRDLATAPRALGSTRRTLETSVALRAAAIVLIVGSHIPLFTVKGGAHLLLGVAGFNFARFQLTAVDRADRIANMRASIRRIALPSMLVILLAQLCTGDYGWPNLLLLNSVLGPRGSGVGWHFWFIEALVYILVAVAALTALPAVDRLERRHPFGLPLALAGVGLLARYDLIGLHLLARVPSAIMVFWLFALGWAAAKAASVRTRAVVTLAALLTVPGFFDDVAREAVVMAGLTLLIWVPALPSHAWVNRLAGTLAGSSLYIYLTHWQVFPRVEPAPLALLASLAAGIAVAALAARITARPGGWRPSALRPDAWRPGRSRAVRAVHDRDDLAVVAPPLIRQGGFAHDHNCKIVEEGRGRGRGRQPSDAPVAYPTAPASR